MNELFNRLNKLVLNSPGWTEIRYHKRQTQSLQVQKGLVKTAKVNSTAGVGVRCFVNGVWGFSSTSDLSERALEKTLRTAFECAKSLSHFKKAQISSLPKTALAKGEFLLPGYFELKTMSLEEKLAAVLKGEEKMRERSNQIETAVCSYNEQFEDKIIISTDGAQAVSQLCRNEIRLTAIAGLKGEMTEGQQTVGRTGPWDCLFSEQSLEELGEGAAKLAVDLLSAPKIPGGKATVILSPGMVGLLSHEAIGHTVEADFVLSGSVAKGKLGSQVASPLVSLCDSGKVSQYPFSGGDLLVDDEGVIAKDTLIIKDGLLNSYLHNRESAAIFGVEPTGNARAWLFNNEPLIRMRNTFILPGTSTLEEMIESTDHGYLVEGPLGGQADATGEFMFGAQKVTEIKNGKLTKLHRGATLSGQAFDVLSTVDAVSTEFQMDLGAGYCGKGQPAKVDAGGPYIRCRAMIGGVQNA